jgi:hypothetical protein
MKTFSSDKYFENSNFYLSVFLLAKGFELVNIRPTESRRSVFVFAGMPEVANVADQFLYAKENSPETLVDSRVMATAIRGLKDKLNA